MDNRSRHDVDHSEPRVVALAHPSLDRLVTRFSSRLTSERRSEPSAGGEAILIPSHRLLPRTLRLGLVVGDRLISVVGVDPDGGATLMTLDSWRGTGVDRELLATAIHRSLTLGATVPVFHADHLDPSLAALAIACGAEVIGCAPVRRLVPV